MTHTSTTQGVCYRKLLLTNGNLHASDVVATVNTDLHQNKLMIIIKLWYAANYRDSISLSQFISNVPLPHGNYA